MRDFHFEACPSPPTEAPRLDRNGDGFGLHDPPIGYRYAMTQTPEDIARRWHDMGGTEGGPIQQDEHDFALWEKRVDALYLICSARGIFTVDALRRVLEDMGPEAFETQSYYERWVQSVNQNLLEAGTYSVAELGEKLAEVQARGNTYGAAAGGNG